MTDHDRIGKTLTFPGEAEPVQHETTMAQPGDGVYIPQHESAYDPIKLARDALRQARIALYVRADTIARLTADNDRLRRERDAALAGAVEVRPLVWSPVESWKQCSRERAPAFGGEYQIVMLDPGEDELPSLYFEIGLGAFMFRFEQDQDPMGLSGETCPRKFPSIEAAKAAAQADYRARILAALHPSPDALQAVTAAAFEAAAKICVPDERSSHHDQSEFESGCRHGLWGAHMRITRMTPADALAAQTRRDAQMRAEEWLAGFEAGKSFMLTSDPEKREAILSRALLALAAQTEEASHV